MWPTLLETVWDWDAYQTHYLRLAVAAMSQEPKTPLQHNAMGKEVLNSEQNNLHAAKKQKGHLLSLS